MKHRRPVFVIVGNHRLRVFLFLRRIDRPRRQPFPLGDPCMVQLPWLRDRKQPLRHAGDKSFVDDAKIKRHRHRRSFVRASVIKFPVHHHGNRNNPSFAFRCQLNQSQRSRPFVHRGFAAILAQLPLSFDERTGDGNRRNQGDGE